MFNPEKVTKKVRNKKKKKNNKKKKKKEITVPAAEAAFPIEKKRMGSGITQHTMR